MFTLCQPPAASLHRSPDAQPGPSHSARRRKNPRQRISDPLAHGPSANLTSLNLPHAWPAHAIRHHPSLPFPWPDTQPEISPNASVGQNNPLQFTFKPPAQGALPSQRCSSSLPHPWPDILPQTSTVNNQRNNPLQTVRSDSPYSPYRILLSSNNVQEYSVSLQGEADGLVSRIYARHQLSLITIDFQAIPLNHWLRNLGRLDLMEYADEQGLALARAVHRVSSAEKAFIRKRLEETSVLRRAIHRSKDEYGKMPFHKAQQALAIARAAKKTIIAEKKLALEHIAEAELWLKTLRETLQAADSKLYTTDRQISRIMGMMDNQGLLPSSPVSEPGNRSTHHNMNTRHHSQDPPSAPDTDVDNISDLSGFESYYDAPSSPEMDTR